MHRIPSCKSLPTLQHIIAMCQIGCREQVINQVRLALVNHAAVKRWCKTLISKAHRWTSRPIPRMHSIGHAHTLKQEIVEFLNWIATAVDSFAYLNQNRSRL